MTAPRGGSQTRFRRYTSGIALAAACGTAIVVAFDGVRIEPRASFAVLAVCTLLGELLPLRVPRRRSIEEFTMSPAYAFAILLVCGPAAAIGVYALACAVEELRARTSAWKAVFNVSQYALSLLAAAATLNVLGAPAPVEGVSSALPAILAAALAFFVLDNTLTGVGVAQLTGTSVTTSVVRDVSFAAWTTGSLVLLGPIVAVAEQASLWLVPLLALPMLAIYLGGRQAVAHNHRLLHDELTELPNRRLVHDVLAEEIGFARAGRGKVAVIAIDLIDFRAVNDALGHRHGDELLGQVARRLEAMLRDGDVLARVGGDEFAIVRSSRSLARPEEVARLVGDVLATPFDVAGISLEVRAAVGAACFPEHGSTPDELLRNADSALHRAKEEAVPLAVYDPQLDEHSVDRLVLAGQLGRAIDAGELRVEYQPKLALADDGRDGVEALVRWRHPELGEIQPGGFVPLAERTGLIRPLTEFVLRESLRQCAAWRSTGLELRMAVNLSPRSLLDSELPASVEAALREAGLDGAWLQLEVTESSIVADAPRARHVLERLRATGVSIAIDDFGTGYSSLSQLQSLPVDEIKIDKSFVIGMNADEGMAAIVRSTVDLGRNLGLAVTAEGVEDEATAVRLGRLGCDYLQGFHIGAPRSPAACRELLTQRLHARRGALGRVRHAVVGLALTMLLAAGPASAATTTSPYVVVLKPDVDPAAATTRLETQYGFRSVLRYRSALPGFSARLSSAQRSGVAADAAVGYVAPDITITAAGTEAPLAGETIPAGVRRVGAATTTTVHQAANPAVAVLDTGVDLKNADLNSVSGRNCITTTAAAQDDNGHGTNVAGILAARNNGAAVTGVAPGTKLYSVKVLNSKKTGTLSQILCGIDWVTANAATLGIKVANLSVTGAGANDNNCGNSNNDPYHQAVCRSVAAGVTYVAAAGNSKVAFTKSVPAAYPEVLAVTAMNDANGLPGGLGTWKTCSSTEKDDQYGTYSNFASTSAELAHAIAAPGTCVQADGNGGGLSVFTGTSQAAPHVAGAAALCIGSGGAAGPCAGLAPAQVIARLRGDAAAGATASNGFLGDPLRPVTGKQFGYLLTAVPY